MLGANAPAPTASRIGVEMRSPIADTPASSSSGIADTPAAKASSEMSWSQKRKSGVGAGAAA